MNNSLTSGQPAFVRNINPELVARALHAKAQQRPIVTPLAQARQSYVALPDGSLMRREDFRADEYDTKA